MPLKVLGDETPKDIFLKASDMLTDSVKHTLGPRGMNTAVCIDSSGHYQIINDGKSIVQDLTSDSPVLAPALELLKQSCFETNRKAGDGTTSTILMTNKLLHNVYNYLDASGDSAVAVRNKLEKIRDSIITAVDNFKQDLNDDRYEDVAKVALGGEQYSSLVSDAYKFVGREGTVAFIKEDRKDVVLDCSNGVTLDKSEFKITPMKEPKELYDCKVILLYERVDRFADLIDVLNKSTEFKRHKTILLYNELSWEAASNIYANIGDARIDIIPIRLGSYGTSTRDIMTQLAEYCDCTLIDGQSVKLSDLGDKIDEVFGNIKKSMLSEDRIVLYNDKEIKENKNYLLQLKNKSCIIRVGGSNKVEQEETFRRIEDAVSSLGTAIKDGITVGGGQAYINAFESIRASGEAEYLEGVDTIIRDTVLENIGCTSEDFNLDDSIFDSAVVIKEVIYNSFSLVAQIITTKKLIHEMIR